MTDIDGAAYPQVFFSAVGLEARRGDLAKGLTLVGAD
jgi:hypothetical protein